MKSRRRKFDFPFELGGRGKESFGSFPAIIKGRSNFIRVTDEVIHIDLTVFSLDKEIEIKVKNSPQRRKRWASSVTADFGTFNVELGCYLFTGQISRTFGGGRFQIWACMISVFVKDLLIALRVFVPSMTRIGRHYCAQFHT